MKHLKKFNESNVQELDKEFLDMVFVNFLDRGMISTFAKNVYELRIKYKVVMDISILKEYSIQIKEDTLELEECLSKVKIEYPDILQSVRMSSQDIIVEIYINEDNYEEDEEDDWDDEEEDDRHTTWNRLHRNRHTWEVEEDEEDDDYPDL